MGRTSTKRPAEQQIIIDGVQITVFASKAPQIKRSGDLGIDEQRQLHRHAFMKTVSLLQDHDDLVFSVLAHVQASIARKAAEHKREHFFAETYCKIKYLPKYFFGCMAQSGFGPRCPHH